MSNILAQGGEVQITEFKVVDGKSGSLDLSKVNELNIYESVLEHSVKCKVVFADTGYREGGLKAVNSGDLDGRYVHLKVQHIRDKRLMFTGDSKLRISLTRDKQESTNKAFITIDLTSKEYNDNPKLKCAVTKKYDGFPDETVKTILAECLKTKKQIEVDQTLNLYNITGKSQTPFYVCTWLASASVPNIPGANQNFAGYFFYETARDDGNGCVFKFKSVDNLFYSQSPKRKLIFNGLIGEVPPEYDGNIIDYSFEKTFNLKQLMQTGALGQTQLRTFNLYDNKYEESEFNYENQYKRYNTGGINPIDWGDDQGETTRRFFSIKDFGVLPSGNVSQQLEKSRDVLNFNVDDVLRQSIMRLNGLYTIKLSIYIAADITLRAGDLIKCDFPLLSSPNIIDKEKSGIYMIHDLCHRITKNGSFTGLNLVRESLGRK